MGRTAEGAAADLLAEAVLAADAELHGCVRGVRGETRAGEEGEQRPRGLTLYSGPRARGGARRRRTHGVEGRIALHSTGVVHGTPAPRVNARVEGGEVFKAPFFGLSGPKIAQFHISRAPPPPPARPRRLIIARAVGGRIARPPT
jgi:hypothetical protein